MTDACCKKIFYISQFLYDSYVRDDRFAVKGWDDPLPLMTTGTSNTTFALPNASDAGWEARFRCMSVHDILWQ